MLLFSNILNKLLLKSKSFLQSFINGRVECSYKNLDRYGRIIGKCISHTKISNQSKKEEIYRPWDILQPINDGDYHPMHDKGIIGVFLKGFFGYNSNPNVIELVLWIAALMFGMNMWRRFYL